MLKTFLSFIIANVMVTFRIKIHNRCYACTIEKRNDYSSSHSRWPARAWCWIVRRQNTGLSFSPCFLSAYLFSPILTSCKHIAGERIRERSRFRRRDGMPGGSEGGGGQGTRMAPGARWVSIMLNRKWSPAIECLFAADPRRHTQWRRWQGS